MIEKESRLCYTASDRSEAPLRRETVLAALRHEPTETIPYHIELTRDIRKSLCARIGVAEAGLDAWMGNYCAKVDLGGKGTSIAEGIHRDDFGVEWDRNGLDKDIGTVRDPVYPDPSFGDRGLPDPDTASARANAERAALAAGDAALFGKIGATLFERAWSLCGFENFLMYTASDPDFAAELLRRVCGHQLALVEAVLDLPLQGFYFGDDYGQQGGTLFSLETFRSLIKPELARLFGPIKKAGKLVVLHSCGNIGAFLDDLIEIGLDAYQTVQPEVYDFALLKRRYGKALAFWGGISTQTTLPFGNPDEVRAAARNAISILGEGGGYIAGPTHRITSDVPVENVLALIKELS